MPGYLLGRFRDFQGEMVYIRNVYLPEHFFLVLEEKVAGAFGEEGVAKLYGAGKRHGYRFCTLARLPRSDLKFSVKMAFEFVEAIYAERIGVTIDLEQKILTLNTVDLAVTRVRGGGASITIGGCAGMWGYFVEDYDLSECGAIHIEGNHYVLICGPGKGLRDNNIKFYESHGAPEIGDVKTYQRLNQPPSVVPPRARNLKQLVDAKVLSNEKGPLKDYLASSLLISTEISLMYDLESLFGSEFVYEVSKEAFLFVGKDVPHQDDRDGFLAEMLTAFGYGIVTREGGVKSESFSFDGAPWYQTAEKSSMPVLRGAIEGFLEGQGGAPSKATLKGIELKNDRLAATIDLVW